MNAICESTEVAETALHSSLRCSQTGRTKLVQQRLLDFNQFTDAEPASNRDIAANSDKAEYRSAYQHRPKPYIREQTQEQRPERQPCGDGRRCREAQTQCRIQHTWRVFERVALDQCFAPETAVLEPSEQKHVDQYRNGAGDREA